MAEREGDMDPQRWLSEHLEAKRARLRGVRSQARARLAARVPECEDFDARRIACDAVVDVMADAAEQDASHARQACVLRNGTDAGMQRQQLERPRQLFCERAGAAGRSSRHRSADVRIWLAARTVTRTSRRAGDYWRPI